MNSKIFKILIISIMIVLILPITSFAGTVPHEPSDGLPGALDTNIGIDDNSNDYNDGNVSTDNIVTNIDYDNPYYFNQIWDAQYQGNVRTGKTYTLDDSYSSINNFNISYKNKKITRIGGIVYTAQPSDSRFDFVATCTFWQNRDTYKLAYVGFICDGDDLPLRILGTKPGEFHATNGVLASGAKDFDKVSYCYATYETNIPMFSNYDDYLDYMLTGNMDNCINSGAFNGTCEPPLDVVFSYKEDITSTSASSYFLSWKQTQYSSINNTYTDTNGYEVTVSGGGVKADLTYIQFKIEVAGSKVGESKFYGWSEPISCNPLPTNNKVYTWGDIKKKCDYSISIGAVQKIYCRLRNYRQFDGKNYYSDYIVLTYDCINNTVSSTTYDNDGNVVSGGGDSTTPGFYDDIYPDDDDDFGNGLYDSDDYLDRLDDSITDMFDMDGDITFSITPFMTYIKSGFGLLGSGGVLTFFRNVFGFLPSEMWTLIYYGLALVIICMLPRFVIATVSSIGFILQSIISNLRGN